MKTKLKRRVHLLGGDKGGVGKTFVCRTAIQLFLDRGIEFTPVEADRYNPDVANRYQSLPFEFAVFTEEEGKTKADKVINEWALENPVIISLPAQVGLPLASWLEDAVEIGAENDVQFVYWFVSSGSYESLDLLKQELQRHGGMMPFVLVCNYGVGDEWNIGQVKELPELMKAYGVKVMEFPKMPVVERDFLDQHNLSYEAARTSELLKKNLMAKGRIERYLKKVYGAFDGTGLMP